jgi:hypothetical protein
MDTLASFPESQIEIIFVFIIIIMVLLHFVGSWPLFQFLIRVYMGQDFLQKGVNPSQGRRLHTQNNTDTE